MDDILTLKLMLNEYKLSPLIAIVKPSSKQTTGSSSRFKIVTDQEVNDFNIKQTNKNTLTKTISDLRIFQAFCNEPEIVIVPVSRKCTVLYENETVVTRAGRP